MPHTDQPRILVVEDDLMIAVSLVKGLEQVGFEARSAFDGERGLELIAQWDPALVVLDLMLPGVDGLEVLRRCRDRTAAPFIVLTARTGLDTRLEAFELGAIDFLGKPFWLEELVARVRLRLGMGRATAPTQVIAFADVAFDLDAHTVTRDDGASIDLTAHELHVLKFLVNRPGRAISRDQIALALSDDGDTIGRTVDSHIARIRKKLGAQAATHIATVWGVGYRFEKASS